MNIRSLIYKSIFVALLILAAFHQTLTRGLKFFHAD